jgi:hypothetical protein
MRELFELEDAMKIQRNSLKSKSMIILAITLLQAGPAMRAIAQIPGDNGIITTTGSGAVLRSTDGGRTWIMVSGDNAGERRGSGRTLGESGNTTGVRAGCIGHSVRVQYRLPKPARVSLLLVDMAGTIIAGRDQGMLAPGEYTGALDIPGQPGGCYYCAVVSNGRVSGVKILIAP